MINYMTTSTTTISDLFSVSSEDTSLGVVVTCTLAALVLGVIIAMVFGRGKGATKGFALSLALLPAIVQMVIMLVNGNVGTGVAVMGAFSLVRFRSAPGSAKDISAIFLAMAAGLACGTEHLVAAFVFTAVMCVAAVAFARLGIGGSDEIRHLKITVPESLDYSGVFDDIFSKYAKTYELEEVKTTNMGSLFKLEYAVTLKDPDSEKAMIDELRKRNGNLEISFGRAVMRTVEQL